jgi:hypothetical protein
MMLRYPIATRYPEKYPWRHPAKCVFLCHMNIALIILKKFPTKFVKPRPLNELRNVMDGNLPSY